MTLVWVGAVGTESRAARIEASIAAIPDEKILVVGVSWEGKRVEEGEEGGEGTLYSRDVIARSSADRVGLFVRP
jgi:hypothetical protein